MTHDVTSWVLLMVQVMMIPEMILHSEEVTVMKMSTSKLVYQLCPEYH